MHTPRLTALGLLGLTLAMGCEPGKDNDDGEVTSDTGVIGEEDDPCDEEPVALVARIDSGRTCPEPISCVGLPEAYDRGWVAFSYTGSALVVESLAEHEVCIDGWYVLTSEESQDSGLGDPGDGSSDGEDGGSDGGSGDDSPGDSGSDGGSGSSDGGSSDGGSSDGGSGSGDGGSDGGDDGVQGDEEDPCDDEEATPPPGGRMTLAPGEALSFGYAGDGLTPDTPTWWCVEETQVTVPTDVWSFNGARMPQILVDHAILPSDRDGDGIEDHIDTTTGKHQTNHNIWDDMATLPMFTVGRDTHYVELAPGESVPVELEVRNMGRVGGEVTFTETLPWGTTASDFSVEPILVTEDHRGRTQLTFRAQLDGAVDTSSYEHTQYAELHVRYTLHASADAACLQRRHGGVPTATWALESGMARSAGSPLIVACCTED